MRIHLLKDLETDLIYQIPEDRLEEFKVTDDELGHLFARLSRRNHILKDLETKFVYQIPEDQLDDFKVPDDELGHLFAMLRIDGVSKPFLEESIEVVAKDASKTSR